MDMICDYIYIFKILKFYDAKHAAVSVIRKLLSRRPPETTPPNRAASGAGSQSEPLFTRTF
jgi:hypothetical protein